MRTVKDIRLSDKDRRAIEAARRLLMERFPVEEVILFGSKARGDDDPESDIDLLLLARYPLSWRERDAITDALFQVELEHDVVLSTLIVARSDWEAGPFSVLPIHDEIVEEGAVA